MSPPCGHREPRNPVLGSRGGKDPDQGKNGEKTRRVRTWAARFRDQDELPAILRISGEENG